MPIHTYRLALRLALKYNMSDIQKGIVDTLCSHIDEDLHVRDQTVALQRVGLMSEFPDQFKRSLVARVLRGVQFSNLTATSVIPLQRTPDTMAALLNWYSARAYSRGADVDGFLKDCGFIND